MYHVLVKGDLHLICVHFGMEHGCVMKTSQNPKWTTLSHTVRAVYIHDVDIYYEFCSVVHPHIMRDWGTILVPIPF